MRASRSPALRTPPIFDIISREGAIPERDMYNTFNMGVGMCAVVAKEDTGRALAALAVNGAADAYICGEIAPRGRRSGAMLKTAVLVSGGGTNLQALIDATGRGEMPHVQLALVVSNRAGAFALERARRAGIRAEYLEKEGFEERLNALLEGGRAWALSSWRAFCVYSARASRAAGPGASSTSIRASSRASAARGNTGCAYTKPRSRAA